MPSSDKSSHGPRDERAAYSYRRKLGVSELLPAIGVAIGAGFLAYYITRIMLERTPLIREGTLESRRAPRVGSPRAALPTRDIHRA